MKNKDIQTTVDIADLTSYGNLTANTARGKLVVENNSHEGMPYGGRANGIGIIVKFQTGPVDGQNNGCFVEDLLIVAKERLEYYQKSKFKCDANQKAIEGIMTAINALENRTKERTERGVEGTHNT